MTAITEPGSPPPLPAGWTPERFDGIDWDDNAAVSDFFDAESDNDGQMILDYHFWRERGRMAEEAQSEDATQRRSRDPEEQRIARRDQAGGGHPHDESLNPKNERGLRLLRRT